MKTTHPSRPAHPNPPRAMNALTKTLLCLIATLPSLRATSVILGDTSGDARGIDSIDIQSRREAVTQVAAGWEATALGFSNRVQGRSSIGVGDHNVTAGDYAVAFGRWNTSDDDEAFTAGMYNTAVAFSIAIGIENLTVAPESVSVGFFNTVESLGASVFGSGITNATDNSTMIGPSNAAKVTILSSGNVGIGTGDTAPAAKLDVVGDIRLSGNLIKAGGGTLTIPTTSGTLVTTSGNQTITGTTTLGSSSASTQWKIDGSTGNVGIGAVPNSSNKLTVVGGASIGSNGTTAAPANGLYVEGRVGIGTTAPLSALSVSGGVSVGAASPAAPSNGIVTQGNVGVGVSPNDNLSVGSSVAGTNVTFGLRGVSSSGASVRTIYAQNATSGAHTVTVDQGQNGDNRAWILNVGAASNALYVNGSGNIGVGTATPAAGNKLHVVGDTKLEGAVTSASAGTACMAVGAQLVLIPNLLQSTVYLGESERFEVLVEGGAFEDYNRTRYLIEARGSVRIFKTVEHRETENAELAHEVLVYQNPATVNTNNMDAYLIAIRVGKVNTSSWHSHTIKVRDLRYGKWLPVQVVAVPTGQTPDTVVAGIGAYSTFTRNTTITPKFARQSISVEPRGDIGMGSFVSTP